MFTKLKLSLYFIAIAMSELMMVLKRHSQNYRSVKMNRNLSGILSKLLASASLLAASTVFAAGNTSAEQSQYLEESRKVAQEFMQTLGGTLKKQLALGGAESAIGVCKEIAPALANEYSKNGRVVKRVSLKNRNPVQGVPDAWEQNVLAGFELAQQQGKPLSGMEVSTVRDESDGRWFRYMKAIPTHAMCLQCHGQPSDISEGVRALLLKEYPQDKAIGYSEGQVRGAISIKRLLEVMPVKD